MSFRLRVVAIAPFAAEAFPPPLPNRSMLGQVGFKPCVPDLAHTFNINVNVFAPLTAGPAASRPERLGGARGWREGREKVV